MLRVDPSSCILLSLFNLFRTRLGSQLVEDLSNRLEWANHVELISHTVSSGVEAIEASQLASVDLNLISERFLSLAFR